MRTWVRCRWKVRVRVCSGAGSLSLTGLGHIANLRGDLLPDAVKLTLQATASQVVLRIAGYSGNDDVLDEDDIAYVGADWPRADGLCLSAGSTRCLKNRGHHAPAVCIC